MGFFRNFSKFGRSTPLIKEQIFELSGLGMIITIFSPNS